MTHLVTLVHIVLYLTYIILIFSSFESKEQDNIDMATAKGLRLMKAIEHYKNNARRWDTNHVFKTVKITSVGNGTMKGSFVVTEDICNAAKTLHGGFSSSAVDAFSVFSYMAHERGAIAWTTDMNMLYINTGMIGDTVQIETRPIRLTKSRAVMECVLTSQTSGKALVRGTVSLQAADSNTVSSIEHFPFDADAN